MRCNNCGVIFDHADVAYAREDYGEIHTICPMCGSPDLSETTSCRVCGNEFDEEDMKCGFCADCLWDALDDYDVVHDYLTHIGSLTDFMLTMVFGCDSLDHTSSEFDELMAKEFWAKVNREKFEKDPSLRDIAGKARDYILPNYPNLFSEEFEFADWYASYLEEHE